MRKSIFMVLFGLILAVQAFALDGVLSSPFGGDNQDTAIYGDYAVWISPTYDNNNLYLYDYVKKTTPVVIGRGSNPSIYGNIIVWTDATLNNNVVMYDISTGNKVQLTTENSYTNAHRPWIQGTKIVWSRSTDGAIQVYDLFTGQTTTLPVTGYDVVVYGDYLAYTSTGSYNYDVYLYNLKTGTGAGTLIGSGNSRPNPPVLIDSKYVYYFGTGTSMDVLHTYEIATQQPKNYDICAVPYHPRAYEGKVYLDANCTGWKTQQFDTQTGVFSIVNTPAGTYQMLPAVYKNEILVEAGGGTGGWYTAIFEITSPSEEVYSLNATANSVTVINPYKQSVVPSSLNFPNVSGPLDARLSPEETKLYILNGDKSVTVAETYDFTTLKKASVTLSGTQSITGITGDDEGNAYITIKKNGTATQVWKVDCTGPNPTGAVSTLVLNPAIAGTNPTGIKISKEGTQYKLFVSDGTTGNVTTINLSDLTTTTIAAGTGSKIVKP